MITIQRSHCADAECKSTDEDFDAEAQEALNEEVILLFEFQSLTDDDSRRRKQMKGLCSPF